MLNDERFDILRWVGLFILFFGAVIVIYFWYSFTPQQVYRVKYEDADGVSKSAYVIDYKLTSNALEFYDVETGEKTVFGGTFEMKPYKKLSRNEAVEYKFPKEGRN